MIVISQNERIVIPFEKFAFVADRGGAIYANPDIVAGIGEWDHRKVAEYKDAKEAKKVLADMVSAYRVDCKTFELPESEV